MKVCFCTLGCFSCHFDFESGSLDGWAKSDLALRLIISQPIGTTQQHVAEGSLQTNREIGGSPVLKTVPVQVFQRDYFKTTDHRELSHPQLSPLLPAAKCLF